MDILHDKDADVSVLNGKTVAVIGYGAQGRAQALCMRDSGVQVIIGLRPGKTSSTCSCRMKSTARYTPTRLRRQ